MNEPTPLGLPPPLHPEVLEELQALRVAEALARSAVRSGLDPDGDVLVNDELRRALLGLANLFQHRDALAGRSPPPLRMIDVIPKGAQDEAAAMPPEATQTVEVFAKPDPFDELLHSEEGGDEVREVLRSFGVWRAIRTIEQDAHLLPGVLQLAALMHLGRRRDGAWPATAPGPTVLEWTGSEEGQVRHVIVLLMADLQARTVRNERARIAFEEEQRPLFEAQLRAIVEALHGAPGAEFLKPTAPDDPGAGYVDDEDEVAWRLWLAQARAGSKS